MEGNGPFPFKDLAQHRHPCERCLRPGHRGPKNLGPSTSSLRPRGTRSPAPPHSDLRILALSPSYGPRPQTLLLIQTLSHKITR